MNRQLTTYNRYRDSNNPLRGLNMPRAVAMMQEAQRGVMANLQWLYAAETGIEATDPDLMAIIERTVSGIATLDWQIITDDERAVGFDQVLADEQAAFLRESYSQCEGLDDAFEHLVMARFRGYSHLQPWIADDWSLDRLDPMMQYNMCRNGTRNEWAWNPEAQQITYDGCPVKLTPDDYIVLSNKRPVNRIALIKYVRATTAEKDWDAYVEIYGIPGVFIIMPNNVPNGKEEEYAEKAEQAAAAASGALPAGSTVTTLSEARSVQPFQTRLEWLQKQLVLAGTGGLLTMLTESGSGTLAGSAHSSTWDLIIRRIADVVVRPLHKQYEAKALRARFGERPCLARIVLRAEQERNAKDAVSNISLLANAGYQVDVAQIERETGYKVTLKPQIDPAATSFPGMTARDPVAKQPEPVAKREDGFAGRDGRPEDTPPLNAILEAFAEGSQKWRSALETLMQDPTPEAAQKLIAQIRDESPDNQPLADAIEQMLATTYTEAINAK